MSSRILVTGSQGFLGRYLVARLEACGFNVHQLVNDVCEYEKIRDEISHTKWSLVLHLAGLSKFDVCQSDPGKAYQVNVLGTNIVLDVLRERNSETPFVLFSTGQVYLYGEELKPSPKGIDEQFPIHMSSNIYSNSKILAEELLRSYSLHGGMKGIILRLFNHSHHTQDSSFFLPSIYSQLMRSRERGEANLRVGNLDLVRDISSLQDLGAAVEHLIRWLNKKGTEDILEIFNLSTGYGKSLKKLVLQMGEKLGVKISIDVDPSLVRRKDPPVVLGDCSKFIRETGWQPTCKDESILIDQFFRKLDHQ